MNGSSARLVVQAGPNAGQIITLGNTPITMGREALNDVAFNDPEVSRRHIRIIPQGYSYVIEDLNSTNGTFVNDQRLTAPVVLSAGDTIRLGELVVMRFEAAAEAPTIVHIAGTVVQPPLGTVVQMSEPEGTMWESPAPAPFPPSMKPGTLPSRPAGFEAHPLPSFQQPRPKPIVEPVNPEPTPATSEIEATQARSSWRRWTLGCGCGLFLLALTCFGVLYWLDANYPDLLYGPLMPIFELLGF